MINIKLYIALLLLLLICAPSTSIACSIWPPGTPYPTQQERILGAENIIVGKRHLTGLKKFFGMGEVYDYETGEPSTTKIRVLHSIKGDIKEGIITVGTSYAMCGYEFLFPDDEPYLMMLQKPTKEGKKLVYQPSGSYNLPATLPFGKNEEGDAYEIYYEKDDKLISLEEFISKNNMKPLPEGFKY